MIVIPIVLEVLHADSIIVERIIHQLEVTGPCRQIVAQVSNLYRF